MKIWTLDARDSMLLEVLSAMLEPSADQMRSIIVSEHRSLIEMLAAGGFDYADFRRALTPTPERVEGALLFNTSKIASSWYGDYVGRALLPVLGRATKQSILTGDLLLDRRELWPALRKALSLELPGSDVESIQSPSEVFGVYLSNMTAGIAAHLDESLRSERSYLGFVESTTDSPLKLLFALSFVGRYLKIGDTFLTPGSPEEVNLGDENLAGWPLEEAGFKCVSVPPNLFDLFLSFKIERRTHPDETDTHFALSAISSLPRDISAFDVLVDQAKHQYLRDHKAGQLGKIGQSGLSTELLQKAIRSKIADTYIYEMEYKEEFDKSFFVINLEFKDDHTGAHRMRANLEYSPSTSTLRLVTLY